MIVPLRALRSEWTKLRTTPSTATLPFATVVATMVLTAAVSAAAAPGTSSCAPGCDTVRLALSGAYLGQIPIVVLAVLAMGGEYQTGLIGPTLAATPRRPVVFAAKAAAVTAAVLPAALVATAGALVVGRVVLPASGFTAARGYPALSVTDGPVLRAAAGTALYLVLVALLSHGLATTLRHPAPALLALLTLLYLTPILAQFVTDEPWHTWLERLAPMTAGLAVQASDPSAQPIGPWWGLAVVAGYAGAALTAGALLFARRDA